MKIKTITTDSISDFSRQFINRTSDGFKPNTAIIFASVEMNLQEMIRFLKDNQVQVFGCSSCGEILYDQADQIISEGGLVCMLLELTPAAYEIKRFAKNDLSSFDLGKTVGDWANSVFQKPAMLILASGLDTDGEQLVNGVQHAAGKDITMFGGLAGDDAQFKNTYVFTEKQIEENGAVAMVLDTAFYDIRGLATSGWVGIGADKIITHSEGNIVYTIDDVPALDVYISYLNINAGELPEIGVEYPLLVKKQGSPDVLRAVINVDREKKALIFAGSVPNGAIVTFSSSPGFEIIESTRNKVIEFYQQNQETDMLILFSCMARHNALGPTISEEIENAWQNWKKPLIGFFTYGEIGSNYNNSCDFHNETFTMVSIKEK
ncbi:MAG: FIST C-terminal domain-containing protein [Bacteroidetes bacterium]|nr:FIST C-terminal domain-containing protein [Bacteroidota bacterium]